MNICRFYLALFLCGASLLGAWTLPVQAQCPFGGCPSAPAPKPQPKARTVKVLPPKPVLPAAPAPVKRSRDMSHQRRGSQARQPRTRVTPPATPVTAATAETDTPVTLAPVRAETQTKARLTVRADAEAKLLLKRVGQNALEVPGERSPEFAVFNNLQSGRYIITAELNDVVSEPVEIEVVAGKQQALDLRLTGALAVTAPPQTQLTVKTPEGDTVRQAVVPASGRLTIAGLVDNRYQVAASCDGYQPMQQEVTVAAQNTVALSLALAPAHHNLSLAIPVAAGWVRFQRADEASEVWQMLAFNEGRAELKNLPPGAYRVVVEPKDKSYSVKELQLTVPVAGNALEVRLEKPFSSVAFAPQTADEWSGGGNKWRIERGRMLLAEEGLALAKEDKFRNYGNFQLSAGVRLTDGKSISFILRAVDAKNYYRVEINGPKARTPNQMRLFVMQNGVERAMSNRPVSLYLQKAMLGAIKDDKPFYVVLALRGDALEAKFLESVNATTTTGFTIKLADNLFPGGAVGCAQQADGKAEIRDFQAQPLP